MLGGVGARVRWRPRLQRLHERLPALAAEFNRRGVLEAAARAPDLQRGAALAAKLHAARIFKAAGWATHRRPVGAASTHRPAPYGDSSNRSADRVAVHSPSGYRLFLDRKREWQGKLSNAVTGKQAATAQPRKKRLTMRQTLSRVRVAALALLLAPITLALADQDFHTERLPFSLTAEGAAAEPPHPTLRSGHVVDIHANGPQIGALERYVINGARPNSSYDVVLEL